MTYLVPIIGHIDLFSLPFENTYFTLFGPKKYSNPGGIVFPHHPLLQ